MHKTLSLDATATMGLAVLIDDNSGATPPPAAAGKEERTKATTALLSERPVSAVPLLQAQSIVLV